MVTGNYESRTGNYCISKELLCIVNIGRRTLLEPVESISSDVILSNPGHSSHCIESSSLALLSNVR